MAGVPVILREDDERVYGLVATEQLRAFLS